MLRFFAYRAAPCRALECSDPECGLSCGWWNQDLPRSPLWGRLSDQDCWWPLVPVVGPQPYPICWTWINITCPWLHPGPQTASHHSPNTTSTPLSPHRFSYTAWHHTSATNHTTHAARHYHHTSAHYTSRYCTKILCCGFVITQFTI
jgi:hypothetical protein